MSWAYVNCMLGTVAALLAFSPSLKAFAVNWYTYVKVVDNHIN